MKIDIGFSELDLWKLDLEIPIPPFIGMGICFDEYEDLGWTVVSVCYCFFDGKLHAFVEKVMPTYPPGQKPDLDSLEKEMLADGWVRGVPPE